MRTPPKKHIVSDELIYIMPGFIHDTGDDVHHMSMVRTCEFDEYGAPIRGTGPSDTAYVIHRCFDVIFYKIRRWLIDHDAIPRHDIFSAILTFLWGLNCLFPPRDVALYTVWYLRGCKPLAVFENFDGVWKLTYPLDRRYFSY